MESEQRTRDLDKYCQQWRERVASAEAHRDELISWKEGGMSVFEKGSNEDQFPTLIDAADNAVKMYKKILTHFETLRDRTRGNDS